MQDSFEYVYRLRSMSAADEVYTGRTGDVRARLKKHNTGQVPHTSRFIPWQLEMAIAFRDRTKAIAFERYLKSGSGREFARRHF